VNAFYLKTLSVLVAVATTFALVNAYNSTSDVQLGNPGLAMEQIEKNDALVAKAEANKVPISLPPAAAGGQLASEAYKNVRVLGHISAGEMTRLMTHMVLWVAPKQGCAYCHAPQRDAAGQVVRDEAGNPVVDQNNLHSDEIYAKVVARRMLQMTMAINGGWKMHVKETGVTCYTCHRGNPVPSQIWYDQPESVTSARLMGERADQNAPSRDIALASLPNNVFRTYLTDSNPIRVISTEPLPIDNRASIKETEWTYGLMMHMSDSLGVNCTHCHNTRSMADWTASPVTRSQAWYGIRMVRQLNTGYLEPLVNVLPPERLGELGDAPKLNCATCHQGAYKPLLGVSMLKDNAVLAAPGPSSPSL
jgi:photosynthetic reaction center cytochrome c subunit